jgi:hypothetical protein
MACIISQIKHIIRRKYVRSGCLYELEIEIIGYLSVSFSVYLYFSLSLYTYICLFWPSPSWIRLTHKLEDNMLYGAYWLK